MRKLILVAVTLLCSGLWAVAQTSSSPSSSGQMGSESGSSSGQMSSSSSNSGSSQSFTGCLSGAAGSYTLRDKATGTTYNLTGDNSQLAKHVNEEVRVSGTEANSSAASSSGTSSTATGSTSGATGGEKSLTVTSVSKVASSCSQ